MMILNFHGVGSPRRDLAAGEDDVIVEPHRFGEILDVVRGHGDVRLTFDDGNHSDVGVVLPELLRRGLRAEFFVCAGRLGTPEFLDEDGVRELHHAGMSVGSHGMDHVPWRGLGRAALRREVFQAKSVLEDVLEAPLIAAACPFGSYDRRSLSAVREAGFARCYTSDGGPAGTSDWLVARNTVRRSDSAESIRLLLDAPSRSAPPLRRVRRWVKRWR